MKILALYDLEDNLITVFKNTQECCDYLNIGNGCLRSFLSRVRNNIRPNKIRSKTENKWYQIFEIEEKEEI